jgi:Fic family protein
MNLSSVQEALKKKLTRFLEAKMPRRTKRLTSLASLLAHKKGTTTLDRETIAKLNALMDLGSNDAALKLPVQLSRVIWNGRVQPVTVSPTQGQSISQLAVKVMQDFPGWLRYDDEPVIQADVEALIGKFAH